MPPFIPWSETVAINNLRSRSLTDLQSYNACIFRSWLELASKDLNHFGVIACLFRQIGGHSRSFVLFCSFWRLFAIKMIKSVKVFPFSFWKIVTKFFFCFIKLKPPAQTCKMTAKWFNSLDTNSNDTSNLLVFVRFLEEIEDTQKPFRNYLTFR